jgi:two-component system, cell cycle sensor histidine kinase and response regulator CckA
MSLPLTPGHPTVPTILVVEDSDAVRTLTARLLTTEGYPVVTANDGVEALEVLERTAIRLVVTDLKMPRMDGHELGKQVARRWPGVGMIFITGHPEPVLTSELPGPLLMKPFVPEALTAAVRTLLTALEGGALA